MFISVTPVSARLNFQSKPMCLFCDSLFRTVRSGQSLILRLVLFVGLAAWGLSPSVAAAQNEVEVAHAVPAQTQNAPSYPEVCSASVEDVQEALSEVRDVFHEPVSPKAPAADAYMDLLGCLDDPESSAHVALRKDIAQHLLLMTDAEKKQLVQAEIPASADPTESLDLKDGAGSYLQTWWRRHDPIPATSGNERLVEHLDRVTFAESNYHWPDRLDGLDDRGRVYVRFGPPSKRVELDIRDQPRLVEYMSRPGIRQGALHASGFPRSEAWLYDINRDSYYLFVEKERLKNRYVIGTTMDLLPTALRRPHATEFKRRSSRESDPRSLFDGYKAGGPRQVILWRSMRWIYKELNYFHPSFHSRLHNLDSDIGVVGETSTEQPTWRTLQDAVRTADAEEAAIAERRDRTMPPHVTNVHDVLPGLPVVWRTTRFRENDGQTTVQVSWGLEPGGIKQVASAWEDADQDATDGYLVMATATKYDQAFRHEQTFRRPLYAPSSAAESSEPLSWKSFMLERGFKFDSSLCMSVQWDLRKAKLEDGGGINVQDQVMSRQVTPIDTLMALSKTPDVLEMSDVMPVYADDPSDIGVERPIGYPFQTIGPETPMALYFELYELEQDEDGQTHYTVTYDVELVQPRGGITRWFRGDKRTNVSTETTYRGSTPTSQEYLQLDLGSIKADERADLQVTVEVVDEVAEETVSRSMQLEWLPTEESQ